MVANVSQRVIRFYANLGIVSYNAASNAIALRPHFVHLASYAAATKLYLLVDINASVHLKSSIKYLRRYSNNRRTKKYCNRTSIDAYDKIK